MIFILSRISQTLRRVIFILRRMIFILSRISQTLRRVIFPLSFSLFTFQVDKMEHEDQRLVLDAVKVIMEKNRFQEQGEFYKVLPGDRGPPD